MARWRRTPEYNGQSLVASAAMIPNTQEAKGRRLADWQQKAWGHYDAVPEIWFAMNYIGNALRRVRLYPAIQPDPQEPPQPLEPSDTLGKQAHAELDRLRSIDGTHGQIIHDAALQLSIPGEGYLALFEDPDPDAPAGSEVAGVFSLAELEKKSDGWYLKSDENVNGTKLSDAQVTRIWRSHPKFKQRADSSMRPLLGPLEELRVLDHQYRSIGRSRVSAGVGFVPEEVRLPATHGPNSTGDGFLDAFLTALSAPVSDEDSALNVVPGLIKAPAQYIEAFRFEKFGREYDPDTAARYDAVLKRVAKGLDLPDAIITGIEDLNHWSAWLVDEDAFDSHLGPLTELICSALTESFLRPALGGDPDFVMGEDVFVWYDPSALISHPNKATDALAAKAAGLISSEAARRYLGYTEDDAPTPEEEAARDAEAEREADLLEQGPPEMDGAPVVASAAAESLGRQLARLEVELAEELQVRCEGVVQRALVKAGGNARERIARAPEGALSVLVADAHDRDVPRLVGKAVLNVLVSDEELADESTLAVIPLFHRLVSKAQRRLRSIVRAHGATADDLGGVDGMQAEYRARAAGVLAASLKGLVASMLYGALPGQERGEASDLTVPPGLIREALAVAGGAHAPAAVNPVTDQPQGGVFNGQTALELFARLEMTPNAWEWFTGAPTRPFEPHQDLDGVRFLDWQDDVLRAPAEAAWLGREFLIPGDHDGCQCQAAPVFGEPA